jgi:site-specific DNA-methyltransferase (adenine-specific)
MTPYYEDDKVALYCGDCREITAWLAADVLVTDPPYGIGWSQGLNRAAGSRARAGIANDADTSTRDAALSAWGDRPGLVFGSFYAPAPPFRQMLIYRKPRDAGLVGSSTGWRRDVEPLYLIGDWPLKTAVRSSLVEASGGMCNAVMRTGHPHTKPLDVMEQLIDACPPGVIADPFAGSGSTLVAARNLGRRAIGVEISERHCERAARRLAQGVLEVPAA